MISKMLAAKIEKEKEEIIRMYQTGTRIAEIAEKYGVVDTTIHRRLHKWGIPIKRGNYRPRVSKYNMKKNKYSPELLKQRAINTAINDDPVKGIQYIKYKNTTEDQILITNIISRSIIG